jgi:hypothetical protein
MKFRRTKATEALGMSQPADETLATAAAAEGEPAAKSRASHDVPRSALRRSTTDQTIDLVRGVRATERLRHGRTIALDPDEVPTNPHGAALADATD